MMRCERIRDSVAITAQDGAILKFLTPNQAIALAAALVDIACDIAPSGNGLQECPKPAFDDTGPAPMY